MSTPYYSSASPPPPKYSSSSNSPASGSPGPPKDHSNLFPEAHWRDLWAAVLFYVNLASTIALAAWAFTTARPHDWFQDMFSPSHKGSEDFDLGSFDVFWGLGVAGSAFAMSFAMFALMKTAPKSSIIFSFWSNITLTFAYGTYLMVGQKFLGGILTLLMGGLLLLLYFAWRRHIPLSAELMRTVSTVTMKYPGTIVATLLDGLITVAFNVFLLSTFALVFMLEEHGLISKDARTALMIYLAFSFYWTNQVAMNILHTIVSGVMATFYFVTGTGQPVGNPAAASARRALTWSFGSVAFGSLLVALIQLLRFMLRSATDRDSIAGAIADCLLNIVQTLVEYFNYYAYIYVAIYGLPYLASARSTWKLIKSHGVDAIINDNLVGTCCNLFSLFGMLLAAGITYLVYTVARPDVEDVLAISITIVSAILTLCITTLMLSIISSGSSATFVCLAEDPAALKRSKPDLYATLSRAYSSIFYNWQP